MRDVGAATDRGTTLLLFPAATLVLIVLGAIAIDLSTIHLARRELVRAVAHAADDGASMIDEDHLRRTGAVRLDLVAAERVARAQLSAVALPGRLVGGVQVTQGPQPDTVAVTASLEVEHTFAKAVPGAPDHEVITVRAEGRLLPVEPTEPP